MIPAPRRILALLLVAGGVVSPAFLRAQDEAAAPATFVGLSYGRYQVADAVYKEVYGGDGAIFGLTASQRLFGARNFVLAAVLDVRHFGRAGASTISQVETRFRMTPIGLGLEGSLQQGIVLVWLGGGLDLIAYGEECELQTTSGSALGFHIAGGLAIQPRPTIPLRLKLILRWTKSKTTANEIPVDLGGPEYGFALLYGFRLF